ncbi:MAG TPA: phosphatase PAP2 family protein [Methylomirabilota bacterium]|nr:phosphatase PAP2 family protein [Methylomirabilota bacterium]
MSSAVSERRRHRRRPIALLHDAGIVAARWLARQEAAVLVAILGVLLALFGFIKITEELLEGDMGHFDEWLLRGLRLPDQPHTPIGPAWLLEAARDLTALGGRTLLLALVLFALGYLALERKYGGMWLVAIAAAGGGFLSTAMKELFGRGRPDVVPHLVAVASPSFPSGHSMLAAIIYLTLGALLARFAARRRTKIYLLTAALALSFLVGSSRVYLGVHYPTDVLAGWCAGLVWALICWLVARYLQYRGTVENPGRR